MTARKLVALAVLTAVFAAGFVLGELFGSKSVASAQGSRVFELRTYTTPEGKLGDLQARFRNHTVKLFEKHGMTNVGYWVPQDAPLSQNTLIYVLAHKNREAAKTSWDAFRADPVWQKARTASEANGRLTTQVVSVFMDPVDFSQMK